VYDGFMSRLSLVSDETDISRLDELERIVERGLATFVEVGDALLAIRDERLYRPLTWEQYCRDRWGFGKNYADKQIRAANEARKLEKTGTSVPKTEGAARRQIEAQKPRESAARVLSDYTDPEAKENPRTQLIEWFNQGRLVSQLLQDGGKIKPRSEDDRQAMLHDVSEMIRLAQSLRRRLK
jgi:hypothetical protein